MSSCYNSMHSHSDVVRTGIRIAAFFVQAVQGVRRFEPVGTVGRHFRFSATVAG